jgi:hypothetical protein
MTQDPHILLPMLPTCPIEGNVSIQPALPAPVIPPCQTEGSISAVRGTVLINLETRMFCTKVLDDDGSVLT